MKNLLTLVLIGLTSLYAQTVPSYVPTNGLVGWWSLNNNVADLSGNQVNGVQYNTTTASDRFNTTSEALSFNGTNSYTEIPNHPILNTIVNELTISVWANPAALNSTGTIIARRDFVGNPNGERHHFELTLNSDGSLLFSAYNNAQLTQTNVQYTTQSNSISQNQWSHIVVVFTNTSLKIFKNNSLLLNQPLNNQVLSPNSHWLNFGRVHRLGGNPFFNEFNGLIDDIGLWNRALTQQEVQALFFGCSDSVQSQPQNFTAYTNPGWANFKSKSTDTAATYQWQQNIGSGWSNLSNFGSYSGSTSDSLVITGVTSSMNNYGYRCIVASCTTDTSDVAVLTVTNGIGLGESKLDKLTVSPNPTNGIVCLNASVIGTYELLTLDGRILESGTAKKEYDLSVYPNGVYNLKLTTDEGTRVLKVVKN